VFFSNAPSRPRSTATWRIARSTIRLAGAGVAADQRAVAAGHDVVQEPDVVVAELAGRDRADADVDLLVRVDLRPELEQRPAAGDRERRRPCRTSSESVRSRSSEVVLSLIASPSPTVSAPLTVATASRPARGLGGAGRVDRR
jgi:hypothetical protein